MCSINCLLFAATEQVLVPFRVSLAPSGIKTVQKWHSQTVKTSFLQQFGTKFNNKSSTSSKCLPTDSLSLDSLKIIGSKECTSSVNSEHKKAKNILCSNPIASKRSINGAQRQQYQSDGGGRDCSKGKQFQLQPSSSLQNNHHRLRLKSKNLQVEYIMSSGKAQACSMHACSIINATVHTYPLH